MSSSSPRTFHRGALPETTQPKQAEKKVEKKQHGATARVLKGYCFLKGQCLCFCFNGTL